MPNLTLRQSKFVTEYSLSGNAADAARRAGYSPNGAKVIGCNLLTNINVQVALAEKRASNAAKLDLRLEEILGGIISGIASAREQKDAGNIIRGYVSLAKLLGLDQPEIKSGNPSARCKDLQAQYELLTDDELMRIIEGEVVEIV
jgi:hypothetical protein